MDSVLGEIDPHRAKRLDVSGPERYAVPCGSEGHLLDMSPVALKIVALLNDGHDNDHVAATLRQQCGVAVEAAQLDELVARIEGQVQDVLKRDRFPGTRWLRRQILDSDQAQSAGSWSAVIMRHGAWSWVLGGAGFLAMVLLMVLESYRRDSVWALVVTYGLFAASVLVHELGHLGASVARGAKPGGAGVLLFFIWPACYSDVSSSWYLDRSSRLYVDAGGAILQSMFGGLLAVLAFVTPYPAFDGAVAMILISLLFNLNPFFRFDGYWIMADWLGVQNVAKAGRKTWGTLIKRESLPYDGWRRYVLLFYSAIRIIAIAIVVVIVFPRILRLGGAATQLLVDIVRLARGDSSVGVLSVASRLMVALFIGRFLYGGVKFIRRRFQKPEA